MKKMNAKKHGKKPRHHKGKPSKALTTEKVNLTDKVKHALQSLYMHIPSLQ